MTASLPGQVVLLNGTSSSGKTTLGRQLLADFETTWFHMGVDMLGAMRAEQRTTNLSPPTSAKCYTAPGLDSTARSPEWPTRATTL
jgi:chloramphenicol 3-O-phosphotransferase